jgi:excisionase family DNA binding protein
MTGRYLNVDDVAARMGIAKRTVHELTRTRRIPHRVMPFGRRCLFEDAWLDAWADGAELEVVDLQGGGRIVRPNASA